MADRRLSSWRAPVFIDRRSLTERQRKHLERYADDIEGRTAADRPTEAASSSASESQETRETENKEKPLGG